MSVVLRAGTRLPGPASAQGSRVSGRKRDLPWLLALICAGCAAGSHDVPVSPEDIWTDAPEDTAPLHSIAFGDRESESYGLPREGQASLADLIQLFPADGIGFDDPDIFVAPDVSFATDQCRGGSPAVVTELPLTVEAVVTLYPRQYLKIPVCGQDERHYGTYTVEDDTGGIVVLRDARTANFSFGDRVRLTVRGLMLTYGLEPDTRAILVADVQPLEPNPEERRVLFRRSVDAFESADVGQVRRVEGYVVDPPTNDNFNQLVLSDKPLPAPDPLAPEADLNCTLVCEAACHGGPCGAAAGLCDPMCETLCGQVDKGQVVTRRDLPACWIVGLGLELGRRGVTFPYGQGLRATGPVVNHFDLQMWIQDTAQLELLPDSSPLPNPAKPATEP